MSFYNLNNNRNLSKYSSTPLSTNVNTINNNSNIISDNNNEKYDIIHIVKDSDILQHKGSIGPRGYIGPQGNVGPQGPRGLKGNTGIGLKGDKGEKGVPGDGSGPTGEKGDPGQMGLTGEKGDPGQMGPTGEKGEKGEKGDPGEGSGFGATGEKGDPGQMGPTGETGMIGPKGDPIINGIVQYKYKNNNFKDHVVRYDLDIVPQLNLDIRPTNINNDILINMKFQYQTSGQADEKIRIIVYYQDMTNPDNHVTISDDILGTGNATILGQTYNLNFIHKAPSTNVILYSVKAQKISNVAKDMEYEDIQTMILNNKGNCILIQELQSINNIINSANSIWQNNYTSNSICYNEGYVGIDNSNPTEALVVNGNIKIEGDHRLNIPSYPPENNIGNKGDVTWDNNFMYICIEHNVWKKTQFI